MQTNDIIALAVGSVILIGVIIYMLVNQRSKIIEWLKYAVAEAEKLLGSGTGQLKLRQVYDWFCEQFPVIAAVLPFRVFSAWVDIALQTFDKWLDNNNFVAYIGYTGGKKHGTQADKEKQS